MTEPKRELTSVDIAAVVGELQGYVGAKFDKFYQYGDDTVRMKVRDYDAGRADLFAEVGETKRLHFVDDPPDAPQRPPNLPMLMRKRLSGGDLVSVEQHGFDRVVRLVGERGDETYTIIVELFGDGNFVFINSEGVVLRSLRTVRLKTRTVAGGEPYEYPPERVDPSALSYEEFVEEMEESGSDLVRTLASVLGFGGTYAEELCTRAGVEKELSIDEATEANYEAVYDEVRALFDSLGSGNLEPQVVYDGGVPVDVTPLPLVRHEDKETEGYETFNEALNAYFDAVDEYEEKQDDDGDEAVEKQRRIVEQQERAIEEREEEEERLREKAEVLYENYGVVVLEFLHEFAALDALDRATVTQFAPELFESLARMHEAGLVHGDLRGENVLVAEGELYFVDATNVDEAALEDARAYDLACALAALEPLVGASVAIEAAERHHPPEMLVASERYLDFVTLRPDHSCDTRTLRGEIDKIARTSAD